jgi:hypothetical protein
MEFIVAVRATIVVMGLGRPQNPSYATDSVHIFTLFM